MDFTANLMIARRLMLATDQLQLYRNGKKVEAKNLKEALDEDAVILSTGSTTPTPAAKAQSNQTVQDQSVRLSDLTRQMDELKTGSAQTAGSPPNVASTDPEQVRQSELTIQRQTVELTIDLHYTPNTPVNGLVKRDAHLAETDRYLLNFKDGTTFTIIDKWANRSTTIWGDPHVDVSDVEGENNGDFQDLKGSDSQTTMMLADGTRVTFTAKDSAVIEAVDIFKDGSHLHGVGMASKDWDGGNNALFNSSVATDGKGASVPAGDVVYAGGDGNDWFTSSGKLVWGQTTGSSVITRPSGYLEVYAQQTASIQTASIKVNETS
jgi:hypothetical protein